MITYLMNLFTIKNYDEIIVWKMALHWCLMLESQLLFNDSVRVMDYTRNQSLRGCNYWDTKALSNYTIASVTWRAQ